MSERCDHADGDCLTECHCGRGDYCTRTYTSCYDCFLDRRSHYSTCITCGQRWHSPEYDTCYQCRPSGRDEAAANLRLEILARDQFACRYCGAAEGDMQTDPRLVRAACPPWCFTEHRHRFRCTDLCRKRHRHRTADDPGTCPDGCQAPHVHLTRDDDGIRPVRLHIDHIQPCAEGGNADPWNLQVLCGVCNIAKGRDWLPGSRHWHARRQIMAAYLTYLRPYLSSEQAGCLDADAEADGLTVTAARALTASQYKAQDRPPRRQQPAFPHRCADCAAQMPGGPQPGCTPDGWCTCLCDGCKARGHGELVPAHSSVPATEGGAAQKGTTSMTASPEEARDISGGHSPGDYS